MITRGNVTCSQLEGNSDIEAKRWVERNIGSLVSKGDVECIKKNGLWLVTKTHHAAEVAKAVFQSRGSQASFDAGVEVPDVTNAKASAAWWSSESVSSGFERQRVWCDSPVVTYSRLMEMLGPGHHHALGTMAFLEADTTTTTTAWRRGLFCWCSVEAQSNVAPQAAHQMVSVGCAYKKNPTCTRADSN
jgi:hypothetical protein